MVCVAYWVINGDLGIESCCCLASYLVTADEVVELLYWLLAEISLFFTDYTAVSGYFVAVQQLHDEHDSAQHAEPVRLHFSAYRSQWRLELTKPPCRRRSQRGMSAACVCQSSAFCAAVSRQTGASAGCATWRRHVRRRHAGVSVGRDELQCAVHARHSQLATQPRPTHGRRRRTCTTVVANRLSDGARYCVSDASYAEYTGRQRGGGDWCSSGKRNRLSSVCRLWSNSTSLTCTVCYWCCASFVQKLIECYSSVTGNKLMHGCDCLVLFQQFLEII